MPNQDFYQGYYDYFSPTGAYGKTTGLYDLWGDIYKYQQNPPATRGEDQYKRVEQWLEANEWENYAEPWNFAAKHYNLHPTGSHASKYNAYLQSLAGGGGDDDKTDFSPNYPAGMPAGYEKYLKRWDKLMRRANLPRSIGKGFGRDVRGFGSDVGMWGDMKGRWDQAQSQADVDIGDVARYAQALRGVEEPLYAKQIRGERLGLENRLLSQGMLGSTGGASQAEALYNAQAQAAAGRDASRYQRAEGMQQQNYQNLLAALQGGQSALTGGGAARQAQQGYHQQNFANQLASLAGAGGLFTGIHNIATDRGLGEMGGLIELIERLK